MSRKPSGTETGEALAPCVLAMLLGLGAGDAGADPFELKTHARDYRGVRGIESGDYEEGIAKLEAQRETRAEVSSLQAPVLIDLCVGYIMARELDKATAACEKSVRSRWYAGLAYNNRGVLKIALGQYESAIRDFEKALEAGGAKSVAGRNLARARERLASLSQQKDRSRETKLAADRAASLPGEPIRFVVVTSRN